MSLAGLQLGRAAGRFIRLRADVLAGLALVGMAAALGLGLRI
jgi:putative Mn2+ efflux pump MntP